MRVLAQLYISVQFPADHVPHVSKAPLWRTGRQSSERQLICIYSASAPDYCCRHQASSYTAAAVETGCCCHRSYVLCRRDVHDVFLFPLPTGDHPPLLIIQQPLSESAPGPAVPPRKPTSNSARMLMNTSSTQTLERQPRRSAFHAAAADIGVDSDFEPRFLAHTNSGNLFVPTGECWMERDRPVSVGWRETDW